MPDDSQIVGYLDGDPSQTEVRLPMRSASSFIADSWKKSHGVNGVSDNADNETDPKGDGNPGDGLTLYEEYRGFIEDGQHIEGDPKRRTSSSSTRSVGLISPASRCSRISAA